MEWLMAIKNRWCKNTLAISGVDSKTDVKFWSEQTFDTKEQILGTEEEEMGGGGGGGEDGQWMEYMFIYGKHR